MKKTLIWLTVILTVTILSLTLIPQLKSSIASLEVFKEDGEEEEGENESGIDKQMSMWFQARAYPDPYYLNEKYQRGWDQAQTIRAQQYGYRIASASWFPIGPNQNVGGRVLAIAIDPSNGNKIFIGTASGGIWKTTTGGTGVNAWQYVQTNLPVLGVSSIIINPSNSNIIYAGTGEVYRIDSTGVTPNPGNTGYNVWKARGTYGIGILKSIDGGINWSQIFIKTMPQLFAIQELRFDPTNSNTIYACTTDGLYRSTDAGVTWNRILNITYVSDVVINAKNNNQIVAAVGNLGNTLKGIYRSTNGGTSWTPIGSGLPASFQGFIKLDNVPTIGNRDTIVASIGVSKVATNELYRSTDFGSTWSGLASSGHTSYQYWSAHTVAIDPSSTDNFIYAGTGTHSYTLPSTSGNIGGIHADVHDIKFDPSNANNVYLACDGGMYKSTNGGGSFNQINNGLGAVQFYATFGVSSITPNLFVGGLQDNGVWRYNGVTWSNVLGGDGGSCAFVPNKDTVFASLDARELYRSLDKGVTFSRVTTGTVWRSVADSRTAFMAPFAISKSTPSTIYLASDNLHKSTTNGGGGSFSFDTYASANNYIESIHKTAIALAVSPTNANKVYVSTSPFAQFDNDADGLFVNGTPNVLKTTTGGTPFASIKSTLPDRFVMDFAISKTFDDSVFIVLGGFVNGTGTSHVYVTGNGGTSWTPVGTGLPDVPFNAILIDPINPQIIYAGGDLGVYVSPNRGGTWYDFNNGFTDVNLVMDLQATADNMIVAATHGKGAFISGRYTSTLPVNITSFTGSYKDAQNKLKWTTENETNLKQYELERSIDGFSFTKVTTIAAINQSGTHNYQYTDPVSSIRSATYYYRLKTVDVDGTSKYSQIITLEVSSIKTFTVLTNPFRDNISLNILLNSRQSLLFTLHDVNGRLIKKQTSMGDVGLNAITIDNIGYISRGVYFLDVIIDREKFTTKLTKN